MRDAWCVYILREFNRSGATGLALDNVGIGAGRHGVDADAYEQAIWDTLLHLNSMLPVGTEIVINSNINLKEDEVWLDNIGVELGNGNLTLMFEGDRAYMGDWDAVEIYRELLDDGLGIWIADRPRTIEEIPLNWAWYNQYIYREGRTRYGCEGPGSEGVKGLVTDHPCYRV